MKHSNPLPGLFLRPVRRGERGALEGLPLERPVEVLQDRWGIPHVFAGGERDLMTAQGFLHARDRLWQMESIRRMTAGTLAEAAGPAMLGGDCFSRLIGLDRLRGRALAGVSERTLALLEAYARGVNAWIAAAGARLPLEFRLLGLRPAPWKVEDLAGALAVNAWFLQTNYQEEVLALHLRDRFTQEQWDELFPGWPGSHLPEEDFFRRWRGVRIGAVLPEALAWYPSLASLSPSTSAAAAPEPLGEALPGASNNWVAARGEGGAPLLANDPHLGVTVPQVWYLCHLHCPQLNVCGASLPGTPGVAIGRNEHLAWGVTNVMTDCVDLFVVRVDPGHPTRYLRQGVYLEMEEERQWVPAAGGRGRTLTIHHTVHGPVITRLEPGVEAAVCLKWYGTWNGPGFRDTTLEGFFDLCRARGLEEAQAAVERIATVGQNFLLADVRGHIAWLPSGRVPVRTGYSGRLPADGSGSGCDWQGFLPAERIPRLVDPPEGLIATANHRMLPEGWPQAVSHTFCAPYRCDRIELLLRAAEHAQRGRLPGAADGRPLAAGRPPAACPVGASLLRAGGPRGGRHPGRLGPAGADGQRGGAAVQPLPGGGHRASPAPAHRRGRAGDARRRPLPVQRAGPAVRARAAGRRLAAARRTVLRRGLRAGPVAGDARAPPDRHGRPPGAPARPAPRPLGGAAHLPVRPPRRQGTAVFLAAEPRPLPRRRGRHHGERLHLQRRGGLHAAGALRGGGHPLAADGLLAGRDRPDLGHGPPGPVRAARAPALRRPDPPLEAGAAGAPAAEPGGGGAARGTAAGAAPPQKRFPFRPGVIILISINCTDRPTAPIPPKEVFLPESLDALYSRLLAEYSEERMKRISAEIIAAYRQGDLRTLNRYASWLRLEPAPSREKINRLFMKLIVFYHPDKRAQKLREIGELHSRGELAGLEGFARGIGADGYRVLEEPRPAREARSPVEEEGFEFEETYAYDEEDFGYREESFEDPAFVDPDTGQGWGWGEPAEPADEERIDDTEEYGFIEAVRDELFGNLDRTVTPGDLLTLDGELVLAGLDIEDLGGIEYCISLSSLDLSRNRISNVHPLAALKNLLSLDLADNEIADADPLAALDQLETLDLSGNELEDVAALAGLVNLRYLNLSGNPIEDMAPLQRMRRNGTIVII